MGIVIVDVHSWAEFVQDDFTIWDSFPGRSKESLKWPHHLQNFPSMIIALISCRSQGHDPFPSWNALHKPSSLGYLREKPCINPAFVNQLTAHHCMHFLDLWFWQGCVFSQDHFQCQLLTCITELRWKGRWSSKFARSWVVPAVWALCVQRYRSCGFLANPIASHISWSAAIIHAHFLVPTSVQNILQS